MKLFLDTETYSPVPITHGTFRYAEQAEVMIFAWAVDAGPITVEDFTATDPSPALRESLAMADEVWAHNVGFDRTVLGYARPDLCPPLERWRCTMVQAYCHGLPGALSTLGEVLRLDQSKKKGATGRSLIHLFCKPQGDAFFKKHGTRRATAKTHPAEWAEFITYAGQDIEAMREVHRRVPMWNYKGAELALWHLDLKINARGAFVDQDLARAAVRAAKTSLSKLADETVEITDGAVASTTQRDALLAYVLDAHGVTLPDMKADTLERRMNDQSLPQAVRDLLAIRLQASMNSASKYTALLNGVSSDGRLRGLAQFCGASRSGRWAHRMFQPGNLMRPPIDVIAQWHGIDKAAVKDHHIHDYVNTGIEAMLAGSEDMTHSNVRALAGAAVRGCIVAPPGKKLVIADLANIEGRVAAWLAGEDWKLAAFRAYDAGEGPDLYKLAYAKSFNVIADEVNKEQRQIGKVEELMFQYQGGVGAWITGAATYGIDLAAMTEAVWPVLPELEKDETEGFLQWLYDMIPERTKDPEAAMLKARYGLGEKTFIACDAIKRLWRKAHPAISSYWKELENTVRAAINSPGVTMQARKLKVRRDGSWLRIGLPSGRALCYFSPSIKNDKICFIGLNPYTKQWGETYTYGGKLFENVTQAVACDQMGQCLPIVEEAGYEVDGFTVHDEVPAEVPDTDEYSHEALATLLCSDLGWNQGLPLAAAGFTTKRYEKG